MTVAEIMEAVKELKVMELSELVKALEEEFGVSATPVAVAGGAAAGLLPARAVHHPAVRRYCGPRRVYLDHPFLLHSFQHSGLHRRRRVHAGVA